MCFKKWFPDPAPVIPAKRRLLTFGRNKYGGQDLNGCVNDSNDLSKKLLGLYPDFDIRKFTDYDVTVARYKSEVTNAINVLSPGATVLILADSCFSGTVTRGMGIVDQKYSTKNRFYNSGLPKRNNIRTKLFKAQGNARWIVISGCGEHQTSADAYINGKYVGAFTCYAILTLQKGMTYREWFSGIRKYLPSTNFDQCPTLEGPEELLNRKVFEDDTLVIHNSSHGTYTYDPHGDEEDGQDEALYFDKTLIDDEINLLLQKIPL